MQYYKFDEVSPLSLDIIRPGTRPPSPPSYHSVTARPRQMMGLSLTPLISSLLLALTTTTVTSRQLYLHPPAYHPYHPYHHYP